jgi:hypothetical protein
MRFSSDASVTPGPWAKSLAPICTLRALWCAVAVIILSEKSILNLRIDAMEPLLGALGSFLIGGDICFQLDNSIFGGTQLIRKLLSHVERMSAVFLGSISSFAKKLKDRLTGFVELIVVVLSALSGSSKLYCFGTHC